MATALPATMRASAAPWTASCRSRCRCAGRWWAASSLPAGSEAVCTRHVGGWVLKSASLAAQHSCYTCAHCSPKPPPSRSCCAAWRRAEQLPGSALLRGSLEAAAHGPQAAAACQLRLAQYSAACDQQRAASGAERFPASHPSIHPSMQRTAGSTCHAKRRAAHWCAHLTAPPAAPLTTPLRHPSAGADSRPCLPPNAMPQLGCACCRPATQPRRDDVYGWRGCRGAPPGCFMSFSADSPFPVYSQLVSLYNTRCVPLSTRFLQRFAHPKPSTNLAPTNEFSAAGYHCMAL